MVGEWIGQGEKVERKDGIVRERIRVEGGGWKVGGESFRG